MVQVGMGKDRADFPVLDVVFKELDFRGCFRYTNTVCLTMHAHIEPVAVDDLILLALYIETMHLQPWTQHMDDPVNPVSYSHGERMTTLKIAAISFARCLK